MGLCGQMVSNVMCRRLKAWQYNIRDPMSSQWQKTAFKKCSDVICQLATCGNWDV